jgi:UDP-N-acetylmuramoyl-tripeptide--D-alanyl-D-alanine ligase
MKKQLIEKFFGICLNVPYEHIEAETDSKRVKPGTIFFALVGKKVDGHAFIEEACTNGAVLIIADETKEILTSSVPVIKVENTLISLQKLAAFHVQYMQVPIIGITGSCGKSTTKEYIAQLLEEEYRVAKTKGNRNSQVGLALSLIDFKGDEQILVLEMGMSEKGNISTLCKMAFPSISVITSIDVNHIENFGSKEKIAEEKSQILMDGKVKLALIEKNAYSYRAIQDKCQMDTIVYSLEQFIQQGSFVVDDFSILLSDLAIKQEHFIKNLIPAVVIAKYFKIPNEKILKKIQVLQILEHRFQFVTNKKCMIIDDSYNSSLESMEQAIANISSQKIQGRKIAVIGAFLEQGDLSEKHHEKLALLLKGKFEQVYCIGTPTQVTVKWLKNFGENASFIDTKQEIADLINQDIQYNDLIFLKGANFYRLWELVDLIKN